MVRVARGGRAVGPVFCKLKSPEGNFAFDGLHVNGFVPAGTATECWYTENVSRTGPFTDDCQETSAPVTRQNCHNANF